MARFFVDAMPQGGYFELPVVSIMRTVRYSRGATLSRSAHSSDAWMRAHP
jgi:hypothetical protein